MSGRDPYGRSVELVLAFLAVFAVNLMPAFGPPTWAVLVWFTLEFDLPAVPLVLGGALAAAGGRLLLASGTRRFRTRLSARRLENLEAAQERFTDSRGKAVAGLGLFALSPVPSAQLFEAAGLLKVRLLPLTAAFFSGRLVSYSLYVGGATLADESLGGLLSRSLGSPVGVALNLVMLAALVALVRVDWSARLGRRGRGPAHRLRNAA